jgi:glycosyltransferase involved in cell wall biosynthesis
VYATGILSAADVSRHVSACDLMLQPYQDGVSGRRTSVMTALAHGVPVVTNEGKATENCWSNSGAVELTEVGDIGSMIKVVRRLLAEEETRKSLSASGANLYRTRFEIQQIILALREPSPGNATGYSERNS